MLPELCHRFLYDQVNPDSPVLGEETPLQDCPLFTGKVSRFTSGCAIFSAPTEDCGSKGMHVQIVRSTARWRNGKARYDTVLLQNEDDEDPMHGMLVGHVLTFLSLVHEDTRYDTALIEWFLPLGEEPDPMTGMWIVRPEVCRGNRNIGLVHTDCIIRGCHLVGVYGRHRVPRDFHFSLSLDAFDIYLNHYIDYHAHEYIHCV